MIEKVGGVVDRMPFIVEVFEYRGGTCVINRPHLGRLSYRQSGDEAVRMLGALAESCNGYVIGDMPVLVGMGGIEGCDYASERVSVHGGWTYCNVEVEAPLVVLGFDGQHNRVVTPDMAREELMRGIDGLIEVGIMVGDAGVEEGEGKP